MKIKELLAVLDISEDEQWWYLVNQKLIPAQYRQLHRADLAFRLRDEVLEGKDGLRVWVAGMFDVYMKMTGSKLFNWKWAYIKGQPIHWIIAALIAKELMKE